MLSAYFVPNPVIGVGDTAVHEAGKVPAVHGTYCGTDEPETVTCDMRYEGNKTGQSLGTGCYCKWVCNI